MKVDMDLLKELVKQPFDDLPTGCAYADGLYQSVVPIIGHTTTYYRLFFQIAELMKPLLVVELGSWRGIAAAHFATASTCPMVVTIDIHREDKAAQEVCRQSEQYYPNLQYINKWTWDAVDDVRRLNMGIDVLFIDAWHEYQYAKREWELYKPLLSSEALIICDDLFDSVGTTDNMLKFWEEMPGEKFVDNVVHTPVPMGFVRWVRE